MMGGLDKGEEFDRGKPVAGRRIQCFWGTAEPETRHKSHQIRLQELSLIGEKFQGDTMKFWSLSGSGATWTHLPDFWRS